MIYRGDDMNALHVFTIWNPEVEPNTYMRHRFVLDNKGKVFWGAIKSPLNSGGHIEMEKFRSTLRKQIEEDRHPYLFVMNLDPFGEHLIGKITRLETGTFGWQHSPLVPEYYKSKYQNEDILIWFELNRLIKIPLELLGKIQPHSEYIRQKFSKYGGRVFPSFCSFDCPSQLDEYFETGKFSDIEVIDFHHNEDFTDVYWRDINFLFSELQAKAIKILFYAALTKTPHVKHQSLLRKIGSEGTRLRDIFKDGKPCAWDTLIKTVPNKGACYLDIKIK